MGQRQPASHFCHATVDFDGFEFTATRASTRRLLVENAERVIRSTKSEQKPDQALWDVTVFAPCRRCLVGQKLSNLEQDRNGFFTGALRCVDFADRVVRFDRAASITQSDLQIAGNQERARIVRVFGQEFAILGQSQFKLSLLREPVGSASYLISI